MTSPPLFASSREALTFAANYKSKSIKTPVMYRMLESLRRANEAKQEAEKQQPSRAPNTLATYDSLDRAGQSGYILQAAGRLPDVAIHAMLAAVMKPREECACRAPCCQGWRTNGEWIDQLRKVDAALVAWLEEQKQAGKKSAYTLTPQLRVELVRQFFDREGKQSQEQLAERFGISEATVAAHQKKIGKHLTGLVRSAFTQLDGLLVPAGIVGALE